MAKDNRRSNRFIQDVSSSSSRRSSRETSSSKQMKETPSKETVSISRKSVRLEKNKPAGTPESKRKLKGVQEQVISPVKKSDKQKKVVEKSASPNMKSKKKIAVKSSKQCVVDTTVDKRYGTRSRKAGRKKRKRVFTLSRRKRKRTEADDDYIYNESEEKSSESNSSGSEDADQEQEKPESSKYGEDKDDSDDECSDMKEEEPLKSDIEVIDVKEEENLDVDITDVKEESMDSGKPTSSKFVEYRVPVQISNLQLEQYCSKLLSNVMALSSCSKSDTVGTIHDILVSNRKCCDHPYIVDQSLQGILTKDLEPIKFLDVGIKASGKLQLLDLILPEMRKRQLRVLILFQHLSGSGKDSTSIGDILDDFVRQRFGEDSYERVDGIGMMPSKKQTALSNFNNKEMGRFVFLLEQRACLSTIKLSSVDTIIIFDSDWNPANDLRALHKITIDSQLEQIMVYRFYTSFTLEEKILQLAENKVTIDSKLQNLSRSTSDALLMWGVKHLFKRLSEFHSSPVVTISSEDHCWDELMEEFLNLISHESNEMDKSKLIITKVQPICGTYGKNLSIAELPDKEEPHTFWRKLLAERNPCWKYLPISTPRQRNPKRTRNSEVLPQKTTVDNDDVGRKRKKTTNNISEPVAAKLVTKEGEVGEVTATSGDAISNETSFRDLLKLKISKLCEVLMLSEDVKIMVERFLEYVIENYRVNKEPTNTLDAFLLSLCWIGSELLKFKLDWKQSLVLANEHLNFSCKEEEVNSVYEKLEPAKNMFLLHSENQKKSDVSKDSMEDDFVVIEVLGAECNKEVAEETVQRNPECVTETSNLQTIDAILGSSSLQSNDETRFLLVSENQSNIPLALQTTEQVSNQAESILMNDQSQRSNNQTHWASRTPFQSTTRDPLQFELEKFCELKYTINKFHEAIKLKLKSDHEKELEEMIAQMNLKYEAKRQEAETAFQLKKKEIDIGFNRVVRNKILAETYRSKCNDLCPFDPSAIRTEGLQNISQFHMTPSSGVTSNSLAQSSGSQQVTELPPPLQIVNQAAQLFSTTPNRSTSTLATKPPPSPFPTGAPSRPSSTTLLSSKQYNPPSTTVSTTTSGGPPSTSVPTSTPIRSYTSVLSSTLSRPESTTVVSNTPIRSSSTTVPTPTSGGPPFTSFPTSTQSRPPSISVPTSASSIPPSSTTHPTNAPHKPSSSTTVTTTTFNRPPSSTHPANTPHNPPSSTTVTTTTHNRPPSSATIPTTTPSIPPSSTTHLTSTPNKPPSSTTVPTTTLNRPPSSTTMPTTTPSVPPSSTTHLTSTSNKPPLSTTHPTNTPHNPPSSTTVTTTSLNRPPSSTTIPTTIPTTTPSLPPSSTTHLTSTPNKPPSSTTHPTSTLNRPPSSTTTPITTPSIPPPSINHMIPSGRFASRPPPNSNPINSPTLLARNPRETTEIRTPAPHIRPFTPSTSVSHRPMSSNFPNYFQASAQQPCPPSLQPQLAFSTNHNGHSTQNSTNHNGHSTQNSPSSSSLPSSQTISSVPAAPRPSFQLPSLSSWLPSELHQARATSSSLPPMPSVSISNTGLYTASGKSESGTLLPSPNLLTSALDLLMDIDKQAGLHQSNHFTSSSGFSDLNELRQEAGGRNDLVCLSDDD